MKKVKRFITACIGPAGTSNTDKFLQGMLQIRNTPDPDCKLSPAQIVFGRSLRDAFSFINCQHKFENLSIHSTWRDAWQSKEAAMKVRFTKSVESLKKILKKNVKKVRKLKLPLYITYKPVNIIHK